MLFLLLWLSWSSERGDTALELTGWQAGAGSSIDGQLYGAHHSGLGADLMLRALPTPDPTLVQMALLDAGERRAALTPDRLALSLARGSPELRTHYVGPTELGPHLGRWVYQDGDTLHWQVLWQTGGGDWYQIIATAPVQMAAPFSTAMREVEESVTVTSRAGAPLLAKKIKHTCPADQHLSRGQVISSSQSFTLAKELLAQHATTPNQTALSELRMMGMLYRVTEACLRTVMETYPGCVVYEAPAQSPQDHLLLAQTRGCLDAAPDMEQTLRALVVP